MQKESRLIQKAELRKQLLQSRAGLSSRRRLEGSLLLLDRFDVPGNILSFAPIGTEIDLTPLNRVLAREQRLFLPRVEENKLVVYRVANLEKHLQAGPHGTLEPNPSLCPKAPLSDIACALIPALGFDPERYRLGYGKGYYDTLLTSHPLFSLGVGFLEQLLTAPLPKDPWDRPVSDLLLT